MHFDIQAIFAGIGTEQIDVVFPSVLGCVTVASDVEHAMARAREVLEFHLGSIIEDQDELPASSDEAMLQEMFRDFEEEGYDVLITNVSVDIPVEHSVGR